MRHQVEGELYNQLETFGGEQYRHIGFRDKKKSFGDMLEFLVPETGMTKKVRITIEILE
ncbi:MAG TPA: hypothetical protein P5123_10550 [Spirochaetota bacterium]|nr:hypothetical protein [Spirochaetota bacterium]